MLHFIISAGAGRRSGEGGRDWAGPGRRSGEAGVDEEQEDE